MIQGIGIDIIELDRIEALIKKGEKLTKRILTPKEYSRFSELSSHRQVEFLAGRFAAKEAFSKAMGTGIGKEVTFQEIEILPNKRNRPIVTTDLFDGKAHVSISHS